MGLHEETRGTPVGRRVFLGMLGLGAAGVVWGAKVQDVLERVLAPVSSITAIAPTVKAALSFWPGLNLSSLTNGSRPNERIQRRSSSSHRFRRRTSARRPGGPT